MADALALEGLMRELLGILTLGFLIAEVTVLIPLIAMILAGE